MKDGTILLYHPTAGESDVLKVLDAAQEAVTRSTFTHVAYWAGGYTWESTIEKRSGGLLPQSGVVQTQGLKPAPLYREPILDLTPAQIDGLVRYGQVQRWTGRRYNVAELVADALIVPTRRFWEWLGWVPFGSNSHGAVCSAFVAKAFVLGALISVFEEIQCADRDPGDFATHGFWRDAT